MVASCLLSLFVMVDNEYLNGYLTTDKHFGLNHPLLISSSMGSAHITLLTLLFSSTLTYALHPSIWRRSSSTTTKTIPAAGFFNPLNNGGSFLAVSFGSCFSNNLLQKKTTKKKAQERFFSI